MPGMISSAARVRALQLLCCAVVAWAGVRATSDSDPTLHLAEAAFNVMEPALRPSSPANVGAAMQAAEAGLSRIEVIVRRTDTLDQIFRRLELSMSDLANLRAMQGLKVMLDLVINHTAIDSPLVTQHPEWYATDEDGRIKHPGAIDPADATKVTVWGDLAELAYWPPPFSVSKLRKRRRR